MRITAATRAIAITMPHPLPSAPAPRSMPTTSRTCRRPRLPHLTAHPRARRTPPPDPAAARHERRRRALPLAAQLMAELPSMTTVKATSPAASSTASAFREEFTTAIGNSMPPDSRAAAATRIRAMPFSGEHMVEVLVLRLPSPQTLSVSGCRRPARPATRYPGWPGRMPRPHSAACHPRRRNSRRRCTARRCRERLRKSLNICDQARMCRSVVGVRTPRGEQCGSVVVPVHRTR